METLSAKTERMIKKFNFEENKDLIQRGYIFDSWYEKNKGVYFLIRSKNGTFKSGDPVRLP